MREAYDIRHSFDDMTLAFSIVLSLFIVESLGVYFYLRYYQPMRERVIRKELELTKDYAEKVHRLSYKILDRGFAINGTLTMDDEFEKRESVDTRDIDELSVEELQDRLEAEAGNARRSKGTIGRRRDLVGEIARRQRKAEEPAFVSEPITEDTSFINSLEPEQMAHLGNLKGAN